MGVNTTEITRFSNGVRPALNNLVFFNSFVGVVGRLPGFFLSCERGLTVSAH